MTNSNISMSEVSSFFESMVESIAAHKGMNAKTEDVRKIINFTKSKPCIYRFELSTAKTALELGFDDELVQQIHQMQNKALMRFVQFLNSVKMGLVSSHDSTHRRLLLALALHEGGSALRYNNLGRIGQNTRIGNDGNEQVLRERINKLAPTYHSLGAVSSKISNLCGSGGWAFCTGLVGAQPYTHNREVFLNKDHLAVKVFLKQFSQLTEGQLKSIIDEDMKKE